MYVEALITVIIIIIFNLVLKDYWCWKGEVTKHKKGKSWSGRSMDSHFSTLIYRPITNLQYAMELHFSYVKSTIKKSILNYMHRC